MSMLDDMNAAAESLALEDKWADAAVKINSQILTMDSDNAPAYARLARCYMEREKWHSARQMCLTLLFFDREDRLAKNNLHKILPHFEEDDTDIMDHMLEMDDYYEVLSLSMSYRARGEMDASGITMDRALQIGKPRQL